MLNQGETTKTTTDTEVTYAIRTVSEEYGVISQGGPIGPVTLAEIRAQVRDLEAWDAAAGAKHRFEIVRIEKTVTRTETLLEA